MRVVRPRATRHCARAGVVVLTDPTRSQLERWLNAAGLPDSACLATAAEIIDGPRVPPSGRITPRPWLTIDWRAGIYTVRWKRSGDQR